MIGLDTGFFFRLLDARPQAVEVWTPIASGGTEGVVSCVSLYELEKAALRGVLDRDGVDVLLADLPVLCRVVWLDVADRLHRAARLSHETGLAMAEALILTSLLDAGAETVYTTDSDFECYNGPATIVHL